MKAFPILHVRPFASTLLVAGLLAACGSSTENGGTPTPRPEPRIPDAPDASRAPSPANTGNTPPLAGPVNAEIVTTLRTAGFTLTTLPADLDELHETGHKRMRAVMKTFTIALGATCDSCHGNGVTAESPDADFVASTPRKEVAYKMWKRFVVALKRNDGSAIYCDSCHQGKMTFLDRADGDALAAWMQVNFVEGLVRKDGVDHACATCHGDRKPGAFIDTWRMP